jgi:DNA-binding MarR family transcriptional regulator
MDSMRPERFEKLMRDSSRDLDASRAVVALARAHGVVTRRVEEARAGTGVTGPRFNVLMELAASPNGRLPLSEVARRLLKSPPNMTTLIDRMEADGWVRRVRPSGDRRLVMAEITDQGWKALRQAAPRVFATEKELLGCLSGGRRRDLARTLDTVAAEALGG